MGFIPVLNTMDKPLLTPSLQTALAHLFDHDYHDGKRLPPVPKLKGIGGDVKKIFSPQLKRNLWVA
jgi:hypothetical protein